MFSIPISHMGNKEGETQGSPPVVQFSPDEIPGLRIWLDAKDASTVTLNSGKVSSWADKTGNGNDFSQSTSANQPTYLSSEGLVQFDGVNDFLRESGTTEGVGSSFSLYMVTKKTAGTQDYLLMMSGGIPSIISEYGGKDFEWFNGGNRYDIKVSSDSELHVIGVRHTDGSSVKASFDGVEVFSNTPTVNNSAKRIQVIGSAISGSTPVGHSNSEVGSILLFDSFLSDSDDTLTVDYLKARRSIS